MQPCKRIEIVIERAQADRLARALNDGGAPGYTAIYHAGGSGDRGVRRADDVTDTDENCVFIIAADTQAQVSDIVAAVQPLLQRFGGLCLVSEAMMLAH